MKTKLELTAAAAGVLLIAAAARAQEGHYRNHYFRHPMSAVGLYHANELSLDAFGSLAINQHTVNELTGEEIRERARLGAGLGLNYFLTRNLGLGGDAYSENTAGHFVDDASGNVILRFPIGATGLAPYVFGGGGHKWDPVEENFAQGGAGLEFRFSPHIGVFADARYVFPDKTKNYVLPRVGLRFPF